MLDLFNTPSSTTKPKQVREALSSKAQKLTGFLYNAIADAMFEVETKNIKYSKSDFEQAMDWCKEKFIE